MSLRVQQSGFKHVSALTCAEAINLKIGWQVSDPLNMRSRFSWTRTSFSYLQPVFEYDILEAVRQHLHHGQEVQLVPYKLNIYGKQTPIIGLVRSSVYLSP